MLQVTTSEENDLQKHPLNELDETETCDHMPKCGEGLKHALKRVQIDSSECPLEFVRLNRKHFPSLIPHDLIEAVKGRTFSAEQFYDYQEDNVGNPHNYLYGLVDDHKIINGFLWCESNLLDGSLFVNTYSVNKKYWGKGEAVGWAVNFLKSMQTEIEAPRVFWATTNEKFFSKHGFKRSKTVLMEYCA